MSRSERPAIRGLLSGASLAMVGLAVLLAFAIRQDRHDRAVDTARSNGLAAAQSLAGDLLSYDYQNLSDVEQRARRGTTGAFTSTYLDLLKRSIEPKATRESTVTHATIARAAVVTVTANELRALLFVDQVTLHGESTKPTTDHRRALVTMRRVGGRWLVADLTSV